MKGKRAAPGPAESVRHRLKADVGLACSVRPGAALETGTVLPHVTGAKVPAPPARELRVVPRKVCLSSQLVGWTMKSLEERDRALIEAAGAAIRRNYDGENFHHTVGAAVRCGSGAVYTGVNVYSIHGACAEQVAIGSAITNGERVLEAIAAVRGKDGSELLPPCGNCRQLLADYAPECEVILPVNGVAQKVPAKDLLPFAYHAEA